VIKKQDFAQLTEQTNSVSELEKILKELNQWLEKEPGNTILLEQRALLYEKLQQYGNAINDYKKIIENNPTHKQATTKIELLSTILRFSNTDIYASPNTNLDPWME